MAQSLDGKIATRSGGSRWISGPKAREWVHRLRAQVDAILIGVETVLKDDPRLTVRTKGRVTKPPVKVILDSNLRTPPTARIFSSRTPVLIATTSRASSRREERLAQTGAEILRLPAANGRVSLNALLKRLGRREISHILIEGGGEVVASAFAAGVVDRVAFVVAPLIIGGKEAPTAVEGAGAASLRQALRLKNLSIRPLGPDFLVTGEPSQ